jgi:hypothetical protein
MVPWAAVLLGIAFIADCSGPADLAPAGPFPRSGDVSGWQPSGEMQRYTREDLFDYMDGEAEMYFVYGFQEMQVQEYVSGKGGPIRVEIYEVDTDANAYGLFTFYRGGQLLDVGNEGDVAVGGRVLFWTDRYVVRVYPVKDAGENDVQSFARLVANELPVGGSPPDLIGRIPAEGLIARSERFFHEKLSLDNIIWTVNENVLNLSAKTDAVAATYEYGGVRTSLLVVAYPEVGAAGVALGNLRAASSETLSVAEQQDRHIVAVFEAPDGDAANDLLQRTLEALPEWSG